ncbi:MAG TPA: thiamine phosphate synthase [Burkholderiales bacterium]|nr:thiamine phosphate synthase [Burkholderiales bacterium]
MSARIAGLYAITPDLADTDLLCRKARAALAGGATVLQYRNKSAAPALRREQAERLHALCREHGVPFVVNDDIDLAIALGADGVHLGRDDGPARAARERIGASMLLGISCYDSLARADAAIAEGADHVAFGSAFPSRVKPNAVRASAALFAEARARYRAPIVAIGGITLDNAPALIAAGVDAVAVISALFDAPDIEQAASSFTALFSRPV